jgi:hypothetical protein
VTPLLKPARDPHPDMLSEMLGFYGCSATCDFAVFQSTTNRILEELRSLTSTSSSDLEQRLVSGSGSLLTYSLGTSAAPVGSVTLSYNRGVTFDGKILWSSLPEIEDVVTSLDKIWRTAEWAVMYAYDRDDNSLQNTTSVPGMHYWGLERGQLNFVTRFGIVEEIDPRGNPGYMANCDGVMRSVQWLNYWSKEAQGQMLAKPIPALPAAVEVHDLENGALRIRLGERPGHFDDTGFHELQLECRRLVCFQPFSCPGYL